MVNRTFILIFYLVSSLFVQSAFTVRLDESMNELKAHLSNGAQTVKDKASDAATTVKDSASSAGRYVKDKAKHLVHAPGSAPAYAPHKAKHEKAHAPDASSENDKHKPASDGHNIVLHVSKNPTFNDVTGDLKNWAYAPHPAAAPMTQKASQLYHSAAGAVKDAGKKIHETIHASMSDVMHKSSKHQFHDVTGGDAKKTFTNWANAPTPAVAPTVHSVSEAAKKKIHNTIHMATKGVNQFLPNTANTHFSDVTGHSAYAPSHAPSPSTVSNAASKRIHKTIHTAMNGNSHMAKPTTFSDATGKTPASFRGWANAPSPLSGHVAGNSVSNAAAHKIHKTIHTAMAGSLQKKNPTFHDATGEAQRTSYKGWAHAPNPSAGTVHNGAKKLHNTIHTSIKDKAKHHYNDVTGNVINAFSHAPAPSSFAAGPAKNAGKKLHNTIHAAMNEKAREILPKKGKHHYNDMTGVGPVDLAHAPAPLGPVASATKTAGKKIHNTIHAALKDKASKTAKHQYSDKTGSDSVVAGVFAHAPTPAPRAAGAVKDAGKKLHKTVHAYMYGNNPDATGYNPYYNNLGRNGMGGDEVQGYQERYPRASQNPWMEATRDAGDATTAELGD
ncbi:hypothetical protein ACHQM5_018618 [Ranunculus cassubicifolius]